MNEIDPNSFRLRVNDDIYEGTFDDKEQLKIKKKGEGSDREVELRLGDRLIDFLHEVASLTGTKFGCGIGACGACKVAVREDPELLLLKSSKTDEMERKNRIIVADVRGELWFHIISVHGKRVDESETSLRKKAEQADKGGKRLKESELSRRIKSLRKRIKRLVDVDLNKLDKNQKEWFIKDAVIADIASICGTYSPPMPVLACYARLKSVNRFHIVTVEGIAPHDEHGRSGLHPLQHEFLKQHAFQCGFSTPGFLMAGYILMAELRERPIHKDLLDKRVLETIGDHICRCTGYHRYFKAIKDVITTEDENADKQARGKGTPDERLKRMLKVEKLPNDYVAPLSSTISFQITKRSENDPSDKVFIGSFENPSGRASFADSLDWANCRKLKVWASTESLRTGIRVRDLNLRNYFFQTTMKALAAAAKKSSQSKGEAHEGGRNEGPPDEYTNLPRNDPSVLMFELRSAREVDERQITAAADMGTPVPVRFHGDLIFAGKRIPVATEVLVFVVSAKQMRIVSQKPLRIAPRDLEFSIERFENEFGIRLGPHAEINCDVVVDYEISKG
jgi:aerobic-type carbon monoxide dehydrogenase small subunit (CoxS/CutS family)